MAQSKRFKEAAGQVERGNLEWHGDRMRVARDRWLWHDGIAADLLVGPSRGA